jgi:hypothetical protein
MNAALATTMALAMRFADFIGNPPWSNKKKRRKKYTAQEVQNVSAELAQTGRAR